MKVMNGMWHGGYPLYSLFFYGRFPRSGYPESWFLLGLSIKQKSSYWGTPPDYGNLHVLKLSMDGSKPIITIFWELWLKVPFKFKCTRLLTQHFITISIYIYIFHYFPVCSHDIHWWPTLKWHWGPGLSQRLSGLRLFHSSAAGDFFGGFFW